MTEAGEDLLAIQRFVEMLMVEAGAAPNTIAAYASDLRAASELLDGGLASVGAEELKLLRSETAVIRHLPSLPAVDLTRAPTSPN